MKYFIGGFKEQEQRVYTHKKSLFGVFNYQIKRQTYMCVKAGWITKIVYNGEMRYIEKYFTRAIVTDALTEVIGEFSDMSQSVFQPTIFGSGKRLRCVNTKCKPLILSYGIVLSTV